MHVARGCIAYRNTRLEQRLTLRKLALTCRDVRLRCIHVVILGIL